MKKHNFVAAGETGWAVRGPCLYEIIGYGINPLDMEGGSINYWHHDYLACFKAAQAQNDRAFMDAVNQFYLSERSAA